MMGAAVGFQIFNFLIMLISILIIIAGITFFTQGIRYMREKKKMDEELLKKLDRIIELEERKLNNPSSEQ